MEEPLPTVPAPDPAGPPSHTDWSKVGAPGGAPRSGFGIGVLLSRTFSTWWKDLPAYVLLGVATAAPMAWGMYHLYSTMPELLRLPPLEPNAATLAEALAPFTRIGEVYARLGFVMVVSAVLSAILHGAIAYAAAKRLRGDGAGLGEALHAGLLRSPHLMLMMIVMTLAFIPAMCAAFVPMVILLCGWSAAVPALVTERAGPIRALSRSWDLTRGYRLIIFVGFLVLYLAMMVVVSAIQAAFIGATLASGGSELADPATMALPIAVIQLVGGLGNSLFLVGCAVVHHGLCLAKEGRDPVQLAQVFE